MSLSKKALAVGAAALIGIAVTGAARAAERDESNALDVYLQPQTVAKLPDGRNFHFYCTGSGGPTILLDAGLGGWSVSWRGIQPKMAEMTRVCAFDRAGYWFSDPGPMPRDAANEVKDLHDALAAAGLKPPYILVGHSYGGMTSYLFALRYNSEIGGMLLIDPSFADQAKKLRDSKEEKLEYKRIGLQCVKLARQGKLHADMAETEKGAECVNPGREDWSKKMSAKLIEMDTKAYFFETQLSEDEEMGARSSREVTALKHSLGAMPLVVLTQDEAHWAQADRLGGDIKKRYAAWVAAHDEIAKSSTRGENVIVPDAGHFIHNDKPDLVLSKLRDIVASVKAPAGK